jgi:ribosome maturation factor RimP
MRTSEHPVVTRIRPEVEQTLADYGYELVQMKLGGRPGNQTLSIMIDKPGGVNSDDCSGAARRISLLLDMLDPLQGSYQLIVSSPGVDRPLTSDADFARFAGQPARVRFTNDERKRETLRGTLSGVEDGRVLLDTEQGRVEIALDDVEAANLVYDWEGEEI